MKYALVSCFIFLICAGLHGQVAIDGTVMSTDNEPLSRINILVYHPAGNVLIAFGVTDENGYFKTSVTSDFDSLRIEASSIQYRNVSKVVANKTQTLRFEMVQEEQELEGVTVRAKAIEQRGDTLSFLVSSFARKEDRSIEEVLKRIPGIEVEPSGRILYQGLPLENFYVEGLDLMDGNYAVVSKNLPQKSVSTVEVMENHQPLKILEDLVSSEQAAINLKLKKDIAMTGTAKLAAGAAPLLWDVNITPMIFTKKFQVVASYQANNTGNDVSGQMDVLTFEDLVSNARRPDKEPAMLGILSAGKPQLDRSRYLDNNVHLVNLNGLQRISNDFQLRANFHYINDYQQEDASLQRTFYLPTDTLAFHEKYYNKRFENYLQGKFTLSRNVKKNYLKNELEIKSGWNKQKGDIVSDGEPVHQQLDEPLRSISNELRSINPVGDHLMEFNSYISYDYSPHALEVIPGQFDEVLNNGAPYDKVTQHVDLKRFFADHYASFILGWKGFTFTPRAGVSYQQNLLESRLYTTSQLQETEAGSDFTNNLDARHTNAYLQTDVEYKKRRLTLKAKLPLSWQQAFLDEKTSEQGQELTRILFDPRLSADYKLGNFWRVRATWSYTNNFGDIGSVYYGYILQNYRSLNRNAAPLSERSNQHLAGYVSYRNPITSFFNSFSYVYSVGHTNLTYSSIVQDDGTTIRQALDLPQTTHMQSLQAYSSKYFMALKSTVTVRAGINIYEGKSLINEELFDTRTIFYFIKPELNVKITSWLNADYGFDLNFNESYIDDELKSDISRYSHTFNVFAFPARNQLVSIESEYYIYQDNENYFFDFLYRYSVPAKKIDLELRWNNIFNNKTYTTFTVSDNIVYESKYHLRASQILLSVRFNF